MVHTRTIVEPIWPVLQKLSKTLPTIVHIHVSKKNTEDGRLLGAKARLAVFLYNTKDYFCIYGYATK